MLQLFKSSIGRLRLIAFLEGFSLLVLLFVAVPVKYIGGTKTLVTSIGPVHGALVLLYLFNTFSAAVEYHWKFRDVTWKAVCACFLPFGTFYVDRILFRPLYRARIQSRDIYKY